MSVKKIVRSMRKLLPSPVVCALDTIASSIAFLCLLIVVATPVPFSGAVVAVGVGLTALTWRIFSDALPPIW